MYVSFEVLKVLVDLSVGPLCCFFLHLLAHERRPREKISVFHGPVSETALLPVLLIGLWGLPFLVAFRIVSFFLLVCFDIVPFPFEVGPVVILSVPRPLLPLLLSPVYCLLPFHPLFELRVALILLVVVWACLLFRAIGITSTVVLFLLLLFTLSIPFGAEKVARVLSFFIFLFARLIGASGFKLWVELVEVLRSPEVAVEVIWLFGWLRLLWRFWWLRWLMSVARLRLSWI